MGQPHRDDTRALDTKIPATAAEIEAVADDLVRCVMSGDYVSRKDAVLVTLGPGRRRWIRRDLTNAGR